IVHGTITPASPQAGAPHLRSMSPEPLSRGATSGKAPSGDWASWTSAIHFSKKAATSMLKEALRTVGRHAEEVAALAPEDVLLELVDQRAGAIERPRTGCGRVDDAPGYSLELRPAGVACDLDVAKAVERETRLVDLLALALQNVGVGLAGRPQVFGVYRAVGVEGLRVAQGHFRSCLAFDLQVHPPDHVPVKVEDVTAALWLGDGLRFQLFYYPDALVRLGHEVGVLDLLCFHPVPSRVVESGLCPTRHLPTGVVGLAHEEVGVEDRARRASPQAFGREALCRAVLILDVELREKLRARAVVGTPVFGVETDESCEPTVAENGAEGVGAISQ